MKSFALLTLLTATASAVPNAVPVPVQYPGTCTMWPNWINTRDSDVTGSISFQVSNADDANFNGLFLQPYTIPWAGSTRPQLGVNFRPGFRFRSTYYRCVNGQVIIGNSAPEVNIAKDRNNAQLVYDEAVEKAGTYRPELYYLEVDGKRLDGVYLGAQNQTTWGFYYQEATCKADGTGLKDFYGAKLSGLPVDEQYPPTASRPAEFNGFLRVVGFTA